MSSPVSRSGPRSASSREVRRRAAPWLVVLSLVAFTGACSRSASAVRLPTLSPDEEIYRISCEDSIQACRDQAVETCAGRYEVLEATGAPVEPPRVTSAPGPASTGPRYQRLGWVGQLVVACGTRVTDLRTPSEAASSGAAPTAAGPGAASSPGDRLCIPGLTQECLGPGACRGAQACSADGNGYGPCDCGERLGTGKTREPSPSTPMGDAGTTAPMPSNP
jgi:hypothetical protein